MPFEVPSSWEWTTVNIISKSILYGVSESAKTSGKYKLLRITDIQNNSVQWESVPYTDFDENKANSYLLSDGDILFARTGATVGKSYLVQGLTEEAIYASYLIRVQTYDVVLPQYVKFYFESGYYWGQIEQGSVGIGQPNVNGTILGNLHIPIPPIHEQCRIVSELSKWMGLIDVIEQGKTDLQAVIKQAKSKILDLATHGKLVPQNPADESASELLKRINPNAEITCDNGQYGKVPEEWSLCKLGDIGEIVTGSTPTKNISEYYGGIIPFYKPADLENGICVKDASDHLTILGYEQARKIPAYSILVTCIGATIGKTGLIIVEGSCNQQINAIIPNEATYAKFIYYTCISDYMQKEIKLNASATTLPILNKGNFAKLLFPLPPLAEQHRIVAKIEELFSYLDNIQKALEV